MGELRKGRLHRALDLSRIGAKLAVGQGRRLLSRDQEASHRQIATTLVRELGQLKGLPMKIGQLLSYMDGVVPDEHRDTYREVLAQLRTTSPPMQRAQAEAVLEQELGEPVDHLFDTFDWEPIASASIGQVYQAHLAGRAVCVKVQYPGIAEATRSDLKNVESVLGLMRSIMPNVDTRQMVEDFRLRLEEECDYRREAAYQDQFATIYREDPSIRVPQVVGERSSERVLTTERLDGVAFETFLADSTQEERDAAARALFRFAFGTLLSHGLFHADPHPGNILFRCREGIGMLDYGCIQPIDDLARRDLAALLQSALQGDELGPAAARAFGITQMDAATEHAIIQICEQVLAPIREAQPFQFSRDFATRISRAVVDAKMKLASRYLTRRGSFKAERAGVMFVVRNLFGLASLWGDLQARGDYRELTQQLLSEAGFGDERMSAARG